MKIVYYHASKFGNGAKVAEEFKQLMTQQGIMVDIHHVKHAKSIDVSNVDLYVFSAPGRFGKPIGDMRNFLKKTDLPSGAKYAVIVTELCPKPEEIKDISVEEKPGSCQLVLPVMNQLLQEKGLKKIAEAKIYVTGLTGPLEKNWQNKVGAFVSAIISASCGRSGEYSPGLTPAAVS